MYTIKNLEQEKGIIKIKQIVDEVMFCFFCTSPEIQNQPNATVMTAQDVDDDGNIWFFSGKDSQRNHDIALNKNINLYFSSPEKDTYFSINAEATVVYDKTMIEKLWNPILKIWFKDGIEDQNISLIKVAINEASYWDSNDGKMVNFFKMLAAVITGIDNTDSVHGSINLNP